MNTSPLFNEHTHRSTLHTSITGTVVSISLLALSGCGASPTDGDRDLEPNGQPETAAPFRDDADDARILFVPIEKTAELFPDLNVERLSEEDLAAHREVLARSAAAGIAEPLTAERMASFAPRQRAALEQALRGSRLDIPRGLQATGSATTGGPVMGDTGGSLPESSSAGAERSASAIGPGDITIGPQWYGNSSACMTASAHRFIQTIGGDIGGISREYGAVTPSSYGRAGCENAHIIDYGMPPALDNNNPGWDWAWIHAAPRPTGGFTQTLCQHTLSSLRVYAYWTFQGNSYREQKLLTFRPGAWNGNACLFDPVDNLWISSAYQRVRAVTQVVWWSYVSGTGWVIHLTMPHYSYFVTHN